VARSPGQAARHAVVPASTLERYSGRYEEREVTLRNGQLYYRRGANPASALAPMAADLLEVEADPSLRVRFVSDGDEPAGRLVEISSDGTNDESARTR